VRDDSSDSDESEVRPTKKKPAGAVPLREETAVRGPLYWAKRWDRGLQTLQAFNRGPTPSDEDIPDAVDYSRTLQGEWD
jgi:hypothetical protein